MWHWPPETRQEVRELAMFLVGAGGLIYILVKDPTQVGLAAIFAGVCIGGVGAGKLRQNGDDRKEDT